jgi:hypothetical protein
MHPTMATHSLGSMVQSGKNREILPVLLELLYQLWSFVFVAGLFGEKKFGHKPKVCPHTHHPHGHGRGLALFGQQVQVRQGDQCSTCAAQKSTPVKIASNHAISFLINVNGIKKIRIKDQPG